MASLDYYGIEELLTDEERAARDRARRFVDEEVRSVVVQCHREGRFPEQLIPRMGALRFFAPHLQGHGCAGLSQTAYGLIMQEFDRADSGLRSLASVQGSLAIHAIHSFGRPEQHARWLPGLVEGKLLGCFALTEHGHGSDPGGMETRAVRDGDQYVLNGSKCWIGNASIADVKVVWAKDEDGRVGGFVVEKDAPGFRAQDIAGKFSLRMSRTSECWFENCRIPAENRLPEAKGLRAPLSCLSQARVGIAWGVIGAAIDCYETALAWRRAASNSAGRLPVSSSCRKSSSGWCRKSQRRSCWRCVSRECWRRAACVRRRSPSPSATTSGWRSSARGKRAIFWARRGSPTSIPSFGI